ncbi:oligogalacturonate-specific porin KdgM family protein [Rouxiella sp. WC2420]
MKINRLLLCGLLLSSTSSQALTIDLRHEWLDDSKQQKDRILLSHRFDNGIGISFEDKWRSGDKNPNRPFDKMVGNGTETTLTYQYKVTPALFLQPGFAVESNTGNNIYKPSLTAGYTFSNGLYFNTRYRYEETRYSNDTSSKKTNRGEIWLGYRLNNWRLEYNYIYRHSNKILFDNARWDYEEDLKLAYNLTKHWTPFAEIGNVSVNSTSHDRQTRFRVGIQYAF